MNAARLSVRFDAVQPPADLEPAIGMFHRFIQRGLVEGLILDVADYRHVPRGPGVILVGHDVDYGVNAAGLTVTRKRTSDHISVALRETLRMGLGALDTIDDDGALDAAFSRARMTISTPDRRLGPSSEVTQQLGEAITPIINELYGDPEILAGTIDDQRTAPSVRVHADGAEARQALDALGGSKAPGQSPWDITAEQLVSMRDSDDQVVLIDVREESEYATVNIGGRLVPLATLGEQIDQLDRTATTVVHCRGGLRGAQAVEQLRNSGFSNAWNLNGGIMAWIDKVDPALPRY